MTEENKIFETDESKANFILFKGLLNNFCRENLKICIDLNRCCSNNDIKNMLKQYHEEIFESLGGDYQPELQDDIESDIWRAKLLYRYGLSSDESDEMGGPTARQINGAQLLSHDSLSRTQRAAF